MHIYSIFFTVIPASPIAVYTLCELGRSETEREMFVLILLLAIRIVGTVLVIIFGKICFNNGDEDIVTLNRKKQSLLKIKFIVVYIFGACHFLHCGLNIWKHIFLADNKVIGLINYIITSLQIFILLIYFALFYQRQYEYTCCQKILLLFTIIFTYSGDSIDALSSNFLCKTHPTHLTPQSVTRATVALQKTEPLISAAIVGFSLLTIALIFPKSSEAHEESDLPTNLTRESDLHTNDACESDMPRNETRLTHFDDIPNNKTKVFKTTIQHFCFIVSFGIIAFTFTILLSNNQSADLVVYVITLIAMKAVILLLVLIIFLILICTNIKDFCKCSCISSFNVGLVILIVTCLYHIFYHTVCIIRSDNTAHANIKFLVFLEYIVTIMMALLQTLVIVGTYLCRTYDNMISKTRMKIIYFLFSLIGMMNMGLWFSDIIGKEMLIYNPVEEPIFWKLCKSFSFLLSIFYRLQTGLEFLKLYWHQNKMT